MKIAHSVDYDPETGKIVIEGVPFDFYVRDDIKVGVLEDKVGFITMSVYTDNLVVGNEIIHSTMNLEPKMRAQVESEWVKREAKRIVHEGMSEVLEWLNISVARDIMDNYQQRYMTGLPNGSQSTKINPDHLN